MYHLSTPTLGLVASHSTGTADSIGRGQERRGSLKKKLSFSRALNNYSENTHHSDVGNRGLNSQSNSDNLIPHSNTCTPSAPSLSPSVFALGLVRQTDLPLTWLDQASVYSCNGLYVPRKTRDSLHSLARRERSRLVRDDIITGDDRTKENFASASLPPSHPKGRQLWSKMVDGKARRDAAGKSFTSVFSTLRTPPYTPTSFPSPRHHPSLNLTPILRLDRCTLTSRNGRLRRTRSVPREVVCCSSKSRMTEGGERTSEDSGKLLRRTKSCRSLPSSPVVLCTKLPLLRRNQDVSSRERDGHAPSSLTNQEGFSRPLFSPRTLQLKISDICNSHAGEEGDAIVSW